MQAMCGLWGSSIWLGHVPSRHGLQGARGRALSGLKAYKHLPQGEAGSKRWLKPNLRTDLAYGVPWSVHLEVTDTGTEHDGPHRIRCLARAGLGWLLSLVPWLPQSRGTDTFNDTTGTQNQLPFLCENINCFYESSNSG
jgi:hypothetical protein